MEEEEKNKIAESVLYPFLFVGVLWIIKLLEHFSEVSLAKLGILPRTIHGILGVATAPLIHGDINHLVSNTLPLLILGIIIMYFYRDTALSLFSWIYVLTGLMVWAVADGSGYHLGASGLIYGLVSFLFFSGLIRKDRRSLALALLVTFVYGGMVWGVLPIYKGVSWESHLIGGIIGAFCAWYYKDLDPAPEETYDWDVDENERNETTLTSPSLEITFSQTADTQQPIVPVYYSYIVKKGNNPHHVYQYDPPFRRPPSAFCYTCSQRQNINWYALRIHTMPSEANRIGSHPNRSTERTPTPDSGD